MIQRFFLAFLLLFSITGQAAANNTLEDHRFNEAFERTINNLIQHPSRKEFKYVFMNQAIDSMSSAAAALSQGDNRTALKWVEQSRHLYSDNAFIYIFRGIIYMRMGEFTRAIEDLSFFYRNNFKPGKFESSFLNPVDYQELRRGVRVILENSGVNTNNTVLRFALLDPVFKSMDSPEPAIRIKKRTLAVFLVLCFLLVMFKFFEADMSALPYRIVGPFAFLSATIYALLALSGMIARSINVNLPWLIVIGISAITAREFMTYINHKYESLPEGYKRCPKCHKAMLLVDIECSHCRHVTRK